MLTGFSKETSHIFDASKFEELSDNEYYRLCKQYYRNKTGKNYYTSLRHSNEQFKDWSVKDLVSTLEQTQDKQTRQQLREEISFRFLSTHISTNIHDYFNVIFPLSESEKTNTPFDGYSIKDVLQLLLSPSFSKLPSKQRRWTLQYIHNFVCRQHNCVPCMVTFNLPMKKQLTGTSGDYFIDFTKHQVSIELADKALLENDIEYREKKIIKRTKNKSTWYDTSGCYQDIFSLVNILHETNHHIITSLPHASTDKELFASVFTARFHVFPGGEFRFPHYAYHSDPAELTAMIFSVQQVEAWIDSNILPDDMRTQIILLNETMNILDEFQSNGSTWEEISTTIKNYVIRHTEIFRSFHPLLNDLEANIDLVSRMDGYLNTLEKDYVWLVKTFKKNLSKVLNYFSSYCQNHLRFTKNLRKYIDVTKLIDTYQVKNNGQFLSLPLTFKPQEISDIIWGTLRILDHEQKENTSLNPHDVIKEYFEERNRIIKQKQQEREEA